MGSSECEINLSHRVKNILDKIESFKSKSRDLLVDLPKDESSQFSNETLNFKCIIDDLNGKLHQYEEENKRLKEDRKNLKGDIDNLKSTIEKKDEYIKSLEDEISSLKESLKNANINSQNNNNKVNMTSPLTPTLTESVISVFPPSAPRSLRKKKVQMSDEKIKTPSMRSDFGSHRKESNMEIKFEVINPIQFELDPPMNLTQEKKDEKEINGYKKDDESHEESFDEDKEKEELEETNSNHDTETSESSLPNQPIMGQPQPPQLKMPPTLPKVSLMNPKLPHQPKVFQPKLTPFQPKLPTPQPNVSSSQQNNPPQSVVPIPQPNNLRVQPKISLLTPKRKENSDNTQNNSVIEPNTPILQPRMPILQPHTQPNPKLQSLKDNKPKSQPNFDIKNNDDENTVSTPKDTLKEQKSTPSFFSKLFSRSKSETKPKSKEMKFDNVKDQNSFYFNKELNMWVERGKEEEALMKKQPPPPPPKSKRSV